MDLITAGYSDVGLVRKSNQDSFGISPEFGFYIVADGMGGHAGGDVASRIAVRTVQADLTTEEATPRKPIEAARLVVAIQHANQVIYDTGEVNPMWNGMGTTIVALVAHESDVIIAFVGDSRGYLYRSGCLRQLTEDHTLINEYVKNGLLTPQSAEHHPMRHVLHRALGTQLTVEVDTIQIAPQSRDIFLLCSDGLSNKLTQEEIGAILTGVGKNLDQSALTLIERAKEKGGEDNITVVLVGYP